MITLEKLAREKTKREEQAGEIEDLVWHAYHWLPYTPGLNPALTFERYKTAKRGAKSIELLATRSDSVLGLIIRKQKQAWGLATVVFEQTVLHPAKGQYVGNYLDYWTLHDDDAAQHVTNDRQVAAQLAAFGGERAFTSVPADHPNPPLNWADVMSAIGEPTVLSSVTRNDPYRIGRSGQPAQLYATAEAFVGAPGANT